MIRRFFPTLMLVVLLFSSCTSTGPRPVIFDTDWWTDVDDACALRVLKAAQADGIFDIKGVCLSAVRPTSAASISSFMDYEGMSGIAVGADKEAVDFVGVPCYHDTLISLHPQGCYKTVEELEDCVPFYRRLLSASKKKVDIIVVGFPNTLSKLLESGPDEYSTLDGKQLVKKKVSHLWLMAGKFPEGSEHNFNNNQRSRAAAYKVCTEWPGPVTFLGWETGAPVKAGGTLPDDDLLRQILLVHGDVDGRSAWDPMTVEMAAMGSAEAAGYEAVQGRVILNPEDGSNSFEESADGPHRYVKLVRDPQFHAARLDSILLNNKPLKYE